MNESTRRDTPAWLDMDQVVKANSDLSDRLSLEGVEFVYDEDGDTLFLTVGTKPRHALTEEVMGNIQVRLDPESLKIVGAMILDFMGDFLANNRLARKSFSRFFTRLREEGTIRVEGEDARLHIAPLFEAALRVS